MQSLQTQFWLIRDALAPVLRTSQFKEHGRITPEEFVAAGDYLVYKFPTWSWQRGDESKYRDFLPKDRQFLLSKNVPSLRRVAQMMYTDADEDAETMMNFVSEGAIKADDDDEWVTTHTNRDPNTSAPNPSNIPSIGDIPDLDHSFPTSDGTVSGMANLSLGGAGATTSGAAEESADEAVPDMDDIPDMEDEDEATAGAGRGIVEEDDIAAAKKPEVQNKPAQAAGSDNLLQLRTYDCFITYDKYYQTPRFWLMGYDEHKKPLSPSQIFSDISPDYAQKTVTIEPFPHLNGISMASVHPCKHANVMKKVIERMNASVIEAQRRELGLSPLSGDEGKKKGGKSWGTGVMKKVTGKDKDKSKGGPSGEGGVDEPEGLRVDQYLIIFLKFISSITPTIEVDSTTAM